MPPSIAIATPVLGGPGTMRARCVEKQQQSLGGPEVVRVVLNSSSSHFGLCNSRLCVGHASVHSDSCSRARGSGGCARARARCVEQQQQQSFRMFYQRWQGWDLYSICTLSSYTSE